MVWFGGLLLAGAAIVAVYGAHRLGLYLESRGLLYYWHRKPQGGAARMWVPLQEAIEPQVRHVIETQERGHKLVEETSGEPE